MKRFAVAMAAVLTVVVWLGCGDDTNGGGGGNNGPPQDKAWVRFGNLSPDAPPIDICVKQSSSQSWGSPVLAANGISGGLTYPAMSKVIFIDPGASLDFRAVAPGGTCDTAVGIDLTAQALNAHGTYTITAVGLLAAGAQGPYRLQQYIEHAEAPAAGKARFRFINVIPDAPPIADGITDGGTWVRSFTEASIPFRVGASGVGIVDGYQDFDPNPALPLTIRPSPPETNLDLYAAPINFRAGIITAVWAIGQVGGSGDQRRGYFVCDEGPAADGGVTTCARQ
jgi:Domain of unknown function (DUF4397)